MNLAKTLMIEVNELENGKVHEIEQMLFKETSVMTDDGCKQILTAAASQLSKVVRQEKDLRALANATGSKRNTPETTE